jgi:hypothetical protein
MQRKDGYEYQAWKNTLELEDGRELTIRFYSETLPQSFDNPEEREDSETDYFIDGKPVDREDLPGEVTDEVLAELEADAIEDSNYDFSGSD